MQEPRSVSGFDRGLSDPFGWKLEVKIIDAQGSVGLAQRQRRGAIDRLNGEAGKAAVRIYGGGQALKEGVLGWAIGAYILQQVVDVATHALQLQDLRKPKDDMGEVR